MNSIYERWIDLKQKNDDYATSLRVVLPELDSLIAAHGLDKKRQEKHNDLKQKFHAALQELNRTLQELCKQPLSPIRREQLESPLNTVHESYSDMYGFSSEQEASTKQQYQTVLDLENYLALLKQAYPSDSLDNGDSLVASLAIAAKIIGTQTDSSSLFGFLPQYSRQLALEALKQLVKERGWPQQLYAAKSILDVLNGKLNPTTYIQSPWGNPVWQRINEELKSKFPDAWNTVEHREFIREISSLQLWETKLVDLRQRLSWAKYADNPDNWRKFIVGEPSDNSLPETEEEAQPAEPATTTDEIVTQSSTYKGWDTLAINSRLDDSREDDNSGGSYEDQNGGNQSQPNPILAALQEAVEARIEIADKPYLGELAAFYMVQALLSQRVINQFNQQLPQTIENLRGAADDLQNISVSKFKQILETVSKAYEQINTIPNVIASANDFGEIINARTTALNELITAWNQYKASLSDLQDLPKTKEDKGQTTEDIDNQISQYALISQARDSALGLLGASATVNDLAQAAQIELASLYIALGLQAVRNFNRTHAQKYLKDSQTIIEGLSSTENQHLYSLLKKLKDGIEWVQKCENGNAVEKLTEWRNAVYDEDTAKAKQAWAQLEELLNAKSLPSGWVVTELAERQMRLSHTRVIDYGDASTEEKAVFDLFLELFDLIESNDNASDCFLLYGRQVKSTSPYSSNPDIFAQFTLDKKKIFLNASIAGLEKKADIVEKLKNHRLTFTQSKHLQTWLSWHEHHEKTRKINQMAHQELVSADLRDFVSKGQINAKPMQLIDHIRDMSLLKKQESDLPLTQSTKDELERAVNQIVTKFNAIPEDAKNAQGELKKLLSACRKFLINLPKDGTFFPQTLEQPDERRSSDSQATDLSSKSHSVQGNLKTAPTKSKIAKDALNPGTPSPSKLLSSKPSILKGIWERLFPKNQNKKEGDSHE